MIGYLQAQFVQYEVELCCTVVALYEVLRADSQHLGLNLVWNINLMRLCTLIVLSLLVVAPLRNCRDWYQLYKKADLNPKHLVSELYTKTSTPWLYPFFFSLITILRLRRIFFQNFCSIGWVVFKNSDDKHKNRITYRYPIILT